MPYSPRNVRIACNHAGLTHYGGVDFFHEFLRALHLRHFLATHLTYPRRNSRYHLSQMVLALMYPIVLGLDTGLPSFPDPQTLCRNDGVYHRRNRAGGVHRRVSTPCFGCRARRLGHTSPFQNTSAATLHISVSFESTGPPAPFISPPQP